VGFRDRIILIISVLGYLVIVYSSYSPRKKQ